MHSITSKYEEVYQSIIRPYREVYSSDLLGTQAFKISEKEYERQDLMLKNSRDQILQCSFYYQKVSVPLPCVVYLHTHSGSRLEALPILQTLLPSNINIFTFDFSGCGNSEGEYVSLGWFERDDIASVVNFLRETGKATAIGLWGRGTGAVAGLLYTDKDPTIGGLVLDSPFASLRQLAEEEINKRVSIPGFIKSVAMDYVRKSILKAAEFDVNDLNILENISNSYTPALFCHGKSDTFIHPHHSKDLYEAYQGDKNLIMLEGNHNSPRPNFFMDSVAIFFYNTLLCESIKVPVSVIEHDPVLSDDSFEIL